MEIIIQPTPEQASRVAARIVAKRIRTKPDAVLGLATGGTPLHLYRELIRMHREEGLDFSRVTTFNLDEYIGLDGEHPQSYHRFMQDNLFRHINVSAGNVHVPDGMTDDVPGSCAGYEQRIREAGGIDLQVLGIGTIMASRQVLLLAFGKTKADAVAASIEGSVSSMMPASALQFHPQAHFLIDEPAAGKLAKADYYRWVYTHKPDWQQH